MRPFERHLRHLVFYVIVVVGAVLSLVSIIVVLELRNPTVPEEVSVTALSQSMDSLRVAARARDAAVISTADSMVERATGTDSVALRLYRSHRFVAEQWNARRAALHAAQGEAMGAVLATYRVDAQRPGNRDREIRYLQLREWYRRQQDRTNAYLDSGRVQLNGAFLAIRSLRDVRVPAEVSARAVKAQAQIDAVQQLLLPRDTFASLPPRRADRKLRDSWTSWHPFAALSDWLRTQRSLELASIVGMLGLGLLGAAASTVIRQRRAEGDPPAVIGDSLSHLVLSGVSAALATYLALKGSLAITSSGSVEPNSYVLLLTCFVAAVYWEEAWERVRKIIAPSDQPTSAAAQAAQQQQQQEQEQQQQQQQIQMGGGQIVPAAGKAAENEADG